MLMAGRLLKKKYNTKYYTIYFYIIFCVSMDKSIYLCNSTLVEAPYFGWHKHQRCIVAKYHCYGHLLYVLFLKHKLNILI